MSDDLKREIALCAFCPKLCRFSCPVALQSGSETYTPGAKVGFIHLSRLRPQSTVEGAIRAIYACSDCLRCRNHCLHQNRVPSLLVEGRREAYLAGHSPGALYDLAVRLDRFGTPFGVAFEVGPEEEDDEEQSEASEEPGPLVEGGGFPEAAPGRAGDEGEGTTSSGRLLFPGCAAWKHTPRSVEIVHRLLVRAGLDHRFPRGMDVCCGYPAWSAGATREFDVCVERLAPLLEGVEEVVSLSPACLYTLSEQVAPRLGVGGVRFRHVSQVLLEAREKHGLAFSSGRTDQVAYHDPCHLARHLGITQEPRDLLRAAGVEPLELAESRQETPCCGAGGCLPMTLPRVAVAMGREVIRRAVETGARVLVTACPSCVGWLRRVSRGALELREVMELLQNSPD